jgi:hypothetical protein
MLVVSWAITRVHLFYAVVTSGFCQFLVATDWARFEDLVIHFGAFSTYAIVR